MTRDVGSNPRVALSKKQVTEKTDAKQMHLRVYKKLSNSTLLNKNKPFYH